MWFKCQQRCVAVQTFTWHLTGECNVVFLLDFGVQECPLMFDAWWDCGITGSLLINTKFLSHIFNSFEPFNNTNVQRNKWKSEWNLPRISRSKFFLSSPAAFDTMHVYLPASSTAACIRRRLRPPGELIVSIYLPSLWNVVYCTERKPALTWGSVKNDQSCWNEWGQLQLTGI